MNADRMPGNKIDFGRYIIRHYDPVRMWKDSDAERRFWAEIPKYYQEFAPVASLGWGAHEAFSKGVSEFVIKVLKPNLVDDEQGHAFRVVEEILTWAHVGRMPDAPEREVLEFRFYQALNMGANDAAIASFLCHYWQCALTSVT